MSAPPLEPIPLTVLVDDVRSFRDGRPCRVARSSSTAVEFLLGLRDHRIDELWLDHDLVRDDTVWPVVRLLEDAHLAGEPFDIGVIHVHASRPGAAHQLLVSVRRAGYEAVRSTNSRLWTW